MLMLILLSAFQPIQCDDRLGDISASQCWTEFGEQADKALTSAWPRLLQTARRLDRQFQPTPRRDKPSRYKDLLAAQRAWLRHREAECSLASDEADGGSLQNVIYSRCYAEMTQKRVEDLRTIVTGWELP